MLQLVNLSNHAFDREIINNSAACLEQFLQQHSLDGIELLFWEEWNPKLHRKPWVKGAHLRFWPDWLDFWRGNRAAVLAQTGGEEQVFATFGGWNREDWLQRYRNEITTAVSAGARYLVFHVSQVRPTEMYDWNFRDSDRTVITATLEVINELSSAIPPDIELLFENLWWPGLTLRDPSAAAALLDGCSHRNCGFMLDSGHLMNTNPQLRSQEQAIDDLLQTLTNLSSLRERIRGIHLHYSLSGAYVKESRRTPGGQSLAELMNHVMQIDQHRPFSSARVQELIAAVNPAYLVHEFSYSNLSEWSAKLCAQQQALTATDNEAAS